MAHMVLCQSIFFAKRIRFANKLDRKNIDIHAHLKIKGNLRKIILKKICSKNYFSDFEKKSKIEKKKIKKTKT